MSSCPPLACLRNQSILKKEGNINNPTGKLLAKPEPLLPEATGCEFSPQKWKAQLCGIKGSFFLDIKRITLVRLILLGKSSS